MPANLKRRFRADYGSCSRCGNRCRALLCRSCRFHLDDPDREARILAHMERVEREEAAWLLERGIKRRQPRRRAS